MLKWTSILIALSVTIGCTHSRVKVDYSKYRLYSSENAGNLKYREISPIVVSESASILTSCEALTAQTARSLLDQAKMDGGNALFNVRWRTESGWGRAPSCETQYGWALLWVVGLLLPWTRHVEAEAVAIKLSEEALHPLKRGQPDI